MKRSEISKVLHDLEAMCENTIVTKRRDCPL